MNPRSIDPCRADVASLAASGVLLTGQWPLADLQRLNESTVATGQAPEAIDWQLSAEYRPVSGGEPELWLHLQATSVVALCCQRCLGAVMEPVEVDRWIRLVPDEAQAELLDAEMEDDVLVLERVMDLRELTEDELLLALPLVPRHEVCPEPLPVPVDDLPVEDEKPNPFAALAALKKL